MEPCGILDGNKSYLIDRLVEKRLDEMQRSGFSIVTNADRDKIRKDIEAELFLRTGITAT